MKQDFLTHDIESLKTNFYYQRITQVLSRMARNGVITLGAGYCTSMGDMVRSALKQQGIDSFLVECQLTLTYAKVDPPTTLFLGFSDVINPGEIDTHLVVVTKTDPPFLIDASLSHRLPPNTIAIVEPLTRKPEEPYVLYDGTYEPSGMAITYHQKKTQSFAMGHNDSIVERIETDKKIFKNLYLLKALIVVALTVSAFNAIRGSYDFYQVYVNDENKRGPSGVESINDRLDKLENLLEEQ
jgi:hypothetical protein